MFLLCKGKARKCSGVEVRGLYLHNQISVFHELVANMTVPFTLTGGPVHPPSRG